MSSIKTKYLTCGGTTCEYSDVTDVFADSTSKGKDIECKVCKRLFHFAKYAAHFRKVHAAAPNGFQCPKCPQHLAYRYRLKAYFVVHHGVWLKDVPCSLCDKMFYRKKLPNTHLLSDGSNAIQHKCALCGKGFQRITGLRRHMSMHEGGREECTLCGKRFPNPAELRIHMLSHTKETQFLCTICAKGFRSQGPLSYHMRKHRKYACIHCRKEFACLPSMRRHEYKHIDLPFQCTRCDMRQATRGSFERHLQEVNKSMITAEEIRGLYKTVHNSRLH